MKNYIYMILLSLCCGACINQDASLNSPNGKISVEYNSGKGFSVFYKGKEGKTAVMTIPVVGLEILNGDTCFKLVDSMPIISIVDDYEMLTGKRKHCHNEANECTYRFENKDGIQINLIFRAYNDGISFRYHFPKAVDIVVVDEKTTFAFTDGIKRWTQAYSVGYEAFYKPNTDGKADNAGWDWSFPALFQPSDDTFILLTEANILRNNTGAYLSNAQSPSCYKIKLFDEQMQSQGDWYSPWRVAIIGSLADVVESTLVTDVSEPCKVADTDWIEPGLVSWIYWAYNHGSKDFQIVKKYADFAADFGLPYMLIDWEWDQMANGGDLKDAIDYCKAKNVAPLLWYNSSTAWCTPTPLYRLNTKEARQNEFKWLKDIGIYGVKIDFFGADSISTMNYYIDLLEDAAKYKLMINFHGAAIPRGWQRTYPHFMSAEAVYGAEWYNNNATLTDNAAWHNCTLPFTRNVIGPMDYTPCAFTDSQNPHITTDAHELALLVVFESGLQHLADRPKGFRQQPIEVQNVIKRLPAAWENTKLLSGYPSEWLVIARKYDDCWYIAGLNGTTKEKSLEVNLDFIEEGAQTIKLFSDSGEGKLMNIEVLDLDCKKLNVNCQPQGGFVIIAE